MDVVRSATHKYVHVGDGTSLLFDLQKDPWQLDNVVAEPGYAEALSAMRATLLDWRLAHDDRTLTAEQITPRGHLTRRDPRR